MNLLFWGMTLSVVGKVMLAYGVIRAHTALEREHAIDDRVTKAFHLERTITLLGVGLIILGYIFEIVFFGFVEGMLTCQGGECTAALGNLIK